jgi:Flp pilus assembly protein TadD
LIALYSQGRLEETVEQAHILIKKISHEFVLFNILGAANMGLDQLEAAIENFNRVIQIQPDYADAYGNLGHALLRNGDLAAAIQNFSQAVKLDPN